jgi:peptide deformylase
MAILPILELPDPVLRQRAKKVRKIDSTVLKLADDMVQTMKDANGIGLAANQVGVLKRVIVIQLPEEEARIYINPEIIYREGEQDWYDGCLSIPGFRGLITRSVWIKFQALTEASTIVKLRADNLLSLAIEHEVDHLNGVLYIDHLKEHEKLIPINEFGTTELDETITTESSETTSVPSSGDNPIDPETPATLKVR